MGDVIQTVGVASSGLACFYLMALGFMDALDGWLGDE